jgi:hypothetical protein
MLPTGLGLLFGASTGFGAQEDRIRILASVNPNLFIAFLIFMDPTFCNLMERRVDLQRFSESLNRHVSGAERAVVT